MIGGVISLAISMLFFAAVVGGIIFVVNMIKNKDKEENKFTFKTLWVGYLYLISMISLIAMLVGLSMVIRSGMASRFGIQFAYPLNYYNMEYETKPTVVDGKEISEPVPFEESYYKDQTKIEVNGEIYYYDGKQVKQDMIQGITLALSMLVLFGIHRYLSMTVKDPSVNMWNKGYVFFGLIITSILSLVLIPISIYQLVTYYVEGWQNLLSTNPYGGLTPPAEALSAMIVFVPAWLVCIFKVNKLNKGQ